MLVLSWDGSYVFFFCFQHCRYEVFHKEQTQIVKQYPDMVRQELLNYDKAVCQLFMVDRNHPVSWFPMGRGSWDMGMVVMVKGVY